MKEISKLNPKLKFVLSGIGEEQPDYWRTIFKNGEIITQEKGKIVFCSDRKSATELIESKKILDYLEFYKAQVVENGNYRGREIFNMISQLELLILKNKESK